MSRPRVRKSSANRARSAPPGRRATPVVEAVSTTPAARAEAEISALNDRAAALVAIRVARRGVLHAERELAQAVDAARGIGASWLQVGLAAELTPGGARKRWSETGRPSERSGRRRPLAAEHPGRTPAPGSSSLDNSG